MKKLLLLIIFFFTLLHPVPAYAIAKESIDYQLPYPGILPDSPFYIFKFLRDKTAEFLIGSPIKKAEFSIVKADSQISSALFLIEHKKNVYKVEPAINNAESYFKQAINNAQQAKTQGMDVSETAKRLVISNLKHREVIIQIEEKIGSELSGDWREYKKKIQSARKRLEHLGAKAKRLG
jgi:hypothetical protein